MSRILIYLSLVLIACQPAANAQEKPADQQIAEAVLAAPAEFRDGAAVLGYSGGDLVTLREGTNEFICLADRAGDERWSVACYHKDLEPFMARGRELRAEGMSNQERARTRFAEIEAGTLEMPRHPTSLYVLSGPADSYNAETGDVAGASHRMVVYVPYATGESLGMPTEPADGRPWLMLPGTPGAHIMIAREWKR